MRHLLSFALACLSLGLGPLPLAAQRPKPAAKPAAKAPASTSARPAPAPTGPLPVFVAGVSHGHTAWVFEAHKAGTDIRIAGIWDADTALAARWARRYGLPASAVYADLSRGMILARPKGVLAYGSLEEHVRVVREACLQRLPVMVEKPLAHTLADALEIERLSKQYQTPVLVNYETTWYPAVAALLQQSRDSLGALRKIEVRSGHMGPLELGIDPSFAAWLTQASRGGGALLDFGCYGANLATLLLGPTEPVSVLAQVAQNKPALYPNCEDEATILVQYPGTQAIIQASWNWPHHRKDATVTGTRGHLTQLDAHRLHYQPASRAEPLPQHARVGPYRDAFHYFADFVRGGPAQTAWPHAELSSLALNLRVMRILAAAKLSAVEGRRVPYSAVR